MTAPVRMDIAHRLNAIVTRAAYLRNSARQCKGARQMTSAELAGELRRLHEDVGIIRIDTAGALEDEAAKEVE